MGEIEDYELMRLVFTWIGPNAREQRGLKNADACYEGGEQRAKGLKCKKERLARGDWRARRGVSSAVQ